METSTNTQGKEGNLLVKKEGKEKGSLALNTLRCLSTNKISVKLALKKAMDDGLAPLESFLFGEKEKDLSLSAFVSVSKKYPTHTHTHSLTLTHLLSHSSHLFSLTFTHLSPHYCLDSECERGEKQ